MESAGVEAGEKMLGMSGEPVAAANATLARHKCAAPITAQADNRDPKFDTISPDSRNSGEVLLSANVSCPFFGTFQNVQITDWSKGLAILCQSGRFTWLEHNRARVRLLSRGFI